MADDRALDDICENVRRGMVPDEQVVTRALQGDPTGSLPRIDRP